jgi:hypothetical protein
LKVCLPDVSRPKIGFGFFSCGASVKYSIPFVLSDSLKMCLKEKIAKLQTATAEAKAQVDVARHSLDIATQQLTDCKEKYKSLPQSEQATLQINDTEFPELLETQIRAKNVLDTVVTRHATNLRYLHAMKQNLGAPK